MKSFKTVRVTILKASLLLQLSAFCLNSPGAAGDVDLSFDPGSGVNGRLTEILVQPDGKVLIAGYFTMVKGLSRTNLARLHADGSGDATFDAGPTMNAPTALALQPDGKLLVAGPFYYLYCDEFECYDYHAASVVRFNADGSRDSTFVAATVEYSENPHEIRCLVPLPDGKILAGGSFYSINGTARVGIARLNPNGTLDTSFNLGAGPNSAVQFVTPQSDGQVLIGGRFTSFDGTNCSSLARLNANGTLDSSFNPDFGGRHYTPHPGGDIHYNIEYPTAATVQSDGKILAGVWREHWQCDAFDGGCFLSYGYSMTRLNSDGTRDVSFAFTNHFNNVALLGFVDSIAVQSDGRIVVGSSAYNTVHIARVNTNGSWDNTFNSGVQPGGVNAVALQPDGKILIGGTFATVNGTNRNHLARLNANGSLDLGFGSDLAVDRAVTTLALQPDGKVLVGGPVVVGYPFFGPLSDVLAFVNGTNRYGRARLNANGSSDRAFTEAPFIPNLALMYPDDCLGPPFGCIQGAVASLRLVQSDGKVILSGYAETTITGDETFFQTYRYFLARYHADGSLDNAFIPPVDTGAAALAQQADGKILLGGGLSWNGTNFTVARLHLDGSVDGSFQLGQGPGSASCLALQPDGKIIVGGNTVVRLNSNGSRDLSFGPVLLSNGAAYSLALQPDGKVVIGGSFTNVNGTNRNRIARLNANGSLDNSFNPGTGTDGRILSIVLQPDGNLLLGGEFTTVNGVVRPYVARLHGADAGTSVNITRSNALVTISWPLTAGFVLDQSFTATGGWSQVSFPYTTNANVISVSTPAIMGNKFFRLRKP